MIRYIRTMVGSYAGFAFSAVNFLLDRFPF